MILIVDDKKENLFSLKSLLEKNEFHVDTATSGEEALKKILKNSYALLLLDVQMPGMDGFEVAEAVSGYSKAKDMPILFLSAVNIEKKFIAKGYSSGGMDYVTKPFDPDLLLLKVRTFYKLSEQTRQLNITHAALREEIEFRKQAENELVDRVKELRSLIEAIPHIAFTINVNGKIEYVNKLWYTYSKKEDVFPEACGGDSSIDVCLKLAWMHEVRFEEEIRIRNVVTNEFRYHLLILTPVITDNEIGRWVGTLTDVHERKLITGVLEQKVEARTIELQKINEQLEISNQDLQQFAYVASHDLKEPLRKIQTLSSIIKKDYLPVENPGSAIVDRIIYSSQRMTHLIDNLLNYSTLSAPQPFESTDISKIIDEVIIDLEDIIHEKRAIVNVGTLNSIDAVPGEIRQVFQNILSNALKFSKKDVPPIINISSEIVDDRSLSASITGPGNLCRLKITDNGIGFDQNYQEKIFTIFQRLNSKSQYEGTGIGLAIVKRILDKHHGKITATSKENIGSEFMIEIPVKQENGLNILVPEVCQ